MKFKISNQTKRELVIFLIVAISFVGLIQSAENNWNEKRIEELKIEKQELEEKNDELWEEFKKDSVGDSIPDTYHNGAELNRAKQRIDDVSVDDSIESQIREISWYSELDSCHYPKDGKCLVASGKIADIGMVATWAYDIGTKLEIDGKIYTVEDRTNREYGHRIDIWEGMGEEAYKRALQKGIQHKIVKIIN